MKKTAGVIGTRVSASGVLVCRRCPATSDLYDSGLDGALCGSCIFAEYNVTPAEMNSLAGKTYPDARA
jgi:hypothetical protein